MTAFIHLVFDATRVRHASGIGWECGGYAGTTNSVRDRAVSELKAGRRSEPELPRRR
jgi:hypothetical protein